MKAELDEEFGLAGNAAALATDREKYQVGK